MGAIGMLGKITHILQSPVKFWTVCFFAIVLSTGTLAAHPCTDGGDSGEESVSSTGKLDLLGYTFEGEFLIIRYSIPFAGVTKVKLFDAANQMLWRGQYVDAEEGDHQIILRASRLNSGASYQFEFSYKLDVRRISVSVP